MSDSMTIQYSRPMPGRTMFGLFHNLDTPSEEVGYVSVHLFGGTMGITWLRTPIPIKQQGDTNEPI